MTQQHGQGRGCGGVLADRPEEVVDRCHTVLGDDVGHGGTGTGRAVAGDHHARQGGQACRDLGVGVGAVRRREHHESLRVRKQLSGER